MITRTQKIGNSQGLRLPRQMLERAQIAVGDDVEVIVGEEEIMIRKVVKPKFNVAKMVARMPKNNKVREEW